MGLDEALDEGVEVEQEELENIEKVSVTWSQTTQKERVWTSETGYSVITEIWWNTVDNLAESHAKYKPLGECSTEVLN